LQKRRRKQAVKVDNKLSGLLSKYFEYTVLGSEEKVALFSKNVKSLSANIFAQPVLFFWRHF